MSTAPLCCCLRIHNRNLACSFQSRALISLVYVGIDFSAMDGDQRSDADIFKLQSEPTGFKLEERQVRETFPLAAPSPLFTLPYPPLFYLKGFMFLVLRIIVWPCHLSQSALTLLSLFLLDKNKHHTKAFITFV